MSFVDPTFLILSNLATADVDQTSGWPRDKRCATKKQWTIGFRFVPFWIGIWVGRLGPRGLGCEPWLLIPGLLGSKNPKTEGPWLLGSFFLTLAIFARKRCLASWDRSRVSLAPHIACCKRRAARYHSLSCKVAGSRSWGYLEARGPLFGTKKAGYRKPGLLALASWAQLSWPTTFNWSFWSHRRSHPSKWISNPSQTPPPLDDVLEFITKPSTQACSDLQMHRQLCLQQKRLKTCINLI